eukprot:7761685-Heterocapsa_arctica.AAC.1
MSQALVSCVRATPTRRRLRPAPEGYSLELNDEGYMYLDDGEKSKWASKVLRCNVWLDHTGEALFVTDGSSLTSKTYFSEYKALVAGTPMG